ncbi:hypothetical protein [Curtanaerobium respiraculi]|uniref:hypothetical protein n=1 Tax=Curtanaerobium respiraculi TaxID=2949669 RepID=UPI0024B3A6BF|nr:hypothetical protein [Curtanaerobium respiraculi]
MPHLVAEGKRAADPDSEVATCFKVPDDSGDHLLFLKAETSAAEPYPGDASRFLLHSTAELSEIASQACHPAVIRELARAFEREADAMEKKLGDPD